MRSLTLRIYLTVVLALALFALVSGLFVRSHLEDQRSRFEGAAQDRLAAWGELLQRSLPQVDAGVAEQAAALHDWSDRLRLPMALDGVDGARIAASDSFLRHEGARPPGAEGRPSARVHAIRLDDGRTLWVLRQPSPRGPAGGSMMGGASGGLRMGGPPGGPLLGRPPIGLPGAPGMPEGLGLAALLLVLFAAVAAGAWPVARRLTRRLAALQQGVEAFGGGALHQRVDQSGHDEVAALGASFNRAAARIEALLRSQKSLLANASHELRSPLARLKMALAMVDDAAPAQRAALQREIADNIGELDALVEEVLLASRLDGTIGLERRNDVDLLALATEEAARVQAAVQAQGDVGRSVGGDERLLRRALRNLLENARRYGGGDIELTLAHGAGGVELRVCDRGPGVPQDCRERIFEPFFRLPGHAETAGGVGLGLSLVRQIAQQHGGSVRCEGRIGGGSCFTLTLP
jgi:signal transduction histidine kinase